MDTTKPDQFFASFKELHSHKVEAYKQYWETLKPLTNEDIFRRYLFAFCSVHTTWEGNIKGYLAIRDFIYWRYNRKDLFATTRNIMSRFVIVLLSVFVD